MCDHTSCNHPQAVTSVQQTLEELDFERGIWTAALDGDKQRVRDLLNKGTEVDKRDGAGYTALHYAVRRGDTEMCRLLLSAGANINAVTRAGQATALHRAAMSGRVEVVKLLIASGADVKLKDTEGRTAEDRAQEYNQPEVFKLLHTE
ncbi:ankyrin repeat domain-containing protein 39-like [Macrosteles quadrilineatus]|uniref:ankyrin repeat domain-containing protein 39-like n=1 Tax=Macrosteles quadrilineatus TaxID=74068 RepID=UPI0023E220FB|nr:ankyrin repeat domain-containing protein 39-like [Macrosteles quadrilineatus]